MEGVLAASPIPVPNGSPLRVYIPNDPYFLRYQWHLKNYDLPAGIAKGSDVWDAWDFLIEDDNGNKNDPNSFAFGDQVLIAIVDNGAWWDHPEMADRNVLFADGGNCDFTQDPTRCLPTIIDPFIDIHATAVAGLALAGRDDSRGIAGVAPDAHWLSNKILPTNPPGTRNVDIGESGGLRPRLLICGLPFAPTPFMETRLGDRFNSAIDIFNNSWGPIDGVDWRTPQAIPGPITQGAIDCGLTFGRGGLGSIYVWAAGNGGAFGDNVNYDRYANQIGTIAVGAIDANGKKSVYSEPGASLLVVAPSSSSFDGGAAIPPQLLTTDFVELDPTVDLPTEGDSGGYNYHTGANDPRGNPPYPPDNDPFEDPNDQYYGLGYTSFGHYSSADPQGGFGGTSSAAPIVSGVIALMLDVNPALTWRDVQHILVRSTWKNDGGDTDWATNRAGFQVNHKYGFGAIDALQAVSNASVWPGSGAQQVFSTGRMTVLRAPTDPVGTVGRIIPDNGGPIAQLFDFATDCFDTTRNLNCTLNNNPLPAGYDGGSFPDLEWIEVVLETDHEFAGDLDVTLFAPDANGQPGQFRSVLATAHGSGENYDNWVFTTARHWGETAEGKWRLEIRDRVTGAVGNFVSWQMNFYGSSIPPIALDDTTTASSGVLKLINVLNNDSGKYVSSSIIIVPGTVPPGHTATARPDGRIEYRSPVGFEGTIAFQYRVFDAGGQPSNAATVTVRVLPFNPAPIAGNDAAVTTFGVPVTIDLLANDVDPPPNGSLDPSSVTLIQPPPASIGTLSPVVNGVVTFTPASGFAGVATFKYLVKDTSGRASNIATVTIDVGPPPPPLPTATNDVVSVVAGMQVTINLLANDFAAAGAPPIDRSSVQITLLPSEGSVSVPDPVTGAVIYASPPGFPGTDIFQYFFRDADGRQSSVATVTINVNAQPIALHDEAMTDEEHIVYINVLGNDSDPDPDGSLNAASLEITSPPMHGTATVDPSTHLVKYTPTCDFVGLDTFSYRVRDNEGVWSNAATVDVTVNESSDAPLANPDVTGTAMNTPVLIRPWENDTDADPGDDVDDSSSMIPFGGGPQHGTLSYNAGTFEYTYTPNPGFTGLDRFNYFVRDMTGEISNMGTSWIRVGPAVSISGNVYADPNNNGIKDPGEIGLSGVLVQAIYSDGALTFTQTVRTDATGRYEFIDDPTHPERPVIMPPGTYTIKELQPGLLADGKDTAGTPPPPIAPTNDRFAGIVLAAGQSATNYNFGEFQLRGDFTVNYLSTAIGFASASLDDGVSDNDPFSVPRPTTGNLSGGPLNLSNGNIWFSFDEGLSGHYFIEAVSNDGTVRLNVYNNNNLTTAVATSGASAQPFSRVEFDGTSLPQFLRVSGTGTDFTLRMGVVDECVQTVAPPTAEVLVKSSSWTQAFLDNLTNSSLGNGGYRIPAGNIPQFDPLTWTGLNQIVVRFSQPTTVAQSSLVVKGFNQATYAVNGFSYDTTTATATWTLATPIKNDRVLIDLNTPQGNFDLKSLTEDGELLRFNVLAGDVDRSGKTSFQDAIAVNNRVGQTIGGPSYSIFHDVNGSGTIDAVDRALVIASGFSQLPAGQPSLPASPSPGAPDAVVVAAATSGPNGAAVLTAARSREARPVDSRLVARVRSDARALAIDSALAGEGTSQDGGLSTSRLRARRLGRAASTSIFDAALESL
ncbi:MAG: Ig-like domain-containing protein [Pirellulales bacterium]